MVSKDQAIGGIIFLVCVVIAILYIVLLLGAQWMEGQGWVTWNPDTAIEEITSEIEEKKEEAPEETLEQEEEKEKPKGKKKSGN